MITKEVLEQPLNDKEKLEVEFTFVHAGPMNGAFAAFIISMIQQRLIVIDPRIVKIQKLKEQKAPDQRKIVRRRKQVKDRSQVDPTPVEPDQVTEHEPVSDSKGSE